MCDFYEMFYENPSSPSRALELTLRRDRMDANCAASDVRACRSRVLHLRRAAVKKGFRVASADQVEDPRKAKGIVKRESCGLSRPAR